MRTAREEFPDAHCSAEGDAGSFDCVAVRSANDNFAQDDSFGGDEIYESSSCFRKMILVRVILQRASEILSSVVTQLRLAIHGAIFPTEC